MASKLMVERIPPDMHIDENGKIVWTPRLIDFNSKLYTRGHTVTAEEFNIELIKQTYQGNYNTDTISVLVGLYNDLNTHVKDTIGNATANAEEALNKATAAENNSTLAYAKAKAASDTANNAVTTANRALTQVTQKMGTVVIKDRQYVSEWDSDTKLDKTGGEITGSLEFPELYSGIRFGFIDASIDFNEENTLWISAQKQIDLYTSHMRWRFDNDGTVSVRDIRGNKTTKLATLEDAQIKDATVENEVLTITKQDGTSFQFEGGGGTKIKWRKW